MRRQNKEEYNHIFFTFGPYHAKLPSPCDHFKLQAAKALTSFESFSSLVTIIQEQESHIRDLYAEPWDHSQHLRQPGALAHLLALDALTIVGAALKPPVFQPQAIASTVLRDAFLLENQIPLSVLQYAIDSIVHDSGGLSLDGVVKAYAKIVGRCCPFSPSTLDQFLSRSWSAPSNLYQSSVISCVYDILTCNNTQSSICLTRSPAAEEETPAANKREEAQTGIPTAWQLQRFGITFKTAEATSGFRSIHFHGHNRVLILPRITVYDSTPSYLLNLSAYEMASGSSGERPVSAYLKMMDYLINTWQDVKLLESVGVIGNELGSHDCLASTWNKMARCLPLTTDTEKDASTVKEVTKACNSTWHKWKMDFCYKYWEKQPWLIFSIIAAFVLLALTCLYTIKVYYLQ